MTATWTVKDSNGELFDRFSCASRLDVGRKVLMPAYYDAFRLHVSPSYREGFDRALGQALQRHGWQIVRTKLRGRTRPRQSTYSETPASPQHLQ
jgi:hypothetical protein